jgi:hypothetical protein
MKIEEAVAEVLDWLYSRGSTTAGFVNIADFDAPWNTPEVAVRISRYAEAHGLATAAFSLSNGAHLSLTMEGVALVHEMRRRRADPAERIPVLRTAMLRWLYRHDSANQIVTGWDAFVNSEEAGFLGDRFLLVEVEHQAKMLERAGLVREVRSSDTVPRRSGISLSDAGYRCLTEYGGDVSEYNRRNDREPATTNNTYFADNKGNLSIGGQNFTQAVQSGVDTSELLKFAGAVRQILPTLELPEDEAMALGDAAEQLHEAASEQEPNVGTLKRLWRSVMSGLAVAAPTVTGDLIKQLGEEAIKAIGG